MVDSERKSVDNQDDGEDLETWGGVPSFSEDAPRTSSPQPSDDEESLVVSDSMNTSGKNTFAVIYR